MVSTHGYTTAAKVKARLKNYQSTIDDADIDIYINHSEGVIIAIMEGDVFKTIPTIIEGIATDLAALYLLAYDPSGFTNIVEAAFIADVIWASSQRNLKLLGDERVRKELKGTE